MADVNSVMAYLHDAPGNLDAIKNLFWSELNYNQANDLLDITDWPADLKQSVQQHPSIFASAGADGKFQIILCQFRQDHLSNALERRVIHELMDMHPYALYLFTCPGFTEWHFVNIKLSHQKSDPAKKRRTILRRISASRSDKLRTACERIALLDISLLQNDLFGIPAVRIQKAHDEAFDVEAVTEKFFSEYKVVFRGLQSLLTRQSGNSAWSHDYSLQFLNRLMFLYFIQKKGWLGNNPDFLESYWSGYRSAGRPTDSFVTEWLEILYFEAFNNKFAAGRADREFIPENLRTVLQMTPYLNGGLFEKNELDTLFQPVIPDHVILNIINFFEQYNFTITEDTPLDQEVAVDPEMIGKVYESLVNVSEEADEQGDAGIFYTPRIEIDLMCRLTLVDWLANHVGSDHNKILYEFVFAYELAEKKLADQAVSNASLWEKLYELLNRVTVLDPACGSGSFLVGMLMILDDLLERSEKALGRSSSQYERRKQIIGQSLYGVDIMDWAVHVTELRLWLQLVIDSSLDLTSLSISEPLLPNLSFKIRRGDSLVQEVGGLNLGLNRHELHLSNLGVFNRELKEFRREKVKFYNNSVDRKYKSQQQLLQAERSLFFKLVEGHSAHLQVRRGSLEAAIQPQTNLFGEIQDPQMNLEIIAKKKELEQVSLDIQKTNEVTSRLSKSKELPFVWEIAFVEIFEGENEGFDIVVGNPPYVRQEKIHDPELRPEQVTTDNKKAYKEKLARAVYAAFPQTFRWNAGSQTSGWKLDKKSDLYIYFYLCSLKLLNPQGSFCFITSNSWLDVGYGADLQQFLLTRGSVKLVLDNQVNRSFKNADVNTVIVMLGAPTDAAADRKESLQQNARFVMFQVPFEYALDPVIWEELDAAEGQLKTPEYRLAMRSQAGLLEAGMDPESDSYAGDKWGGKYLRAPDIYWVILEKANDKLIKLKDVALINTISWSRLGNNSKVIIPKETTISSKNNLIPLIKSPRDFSRIEIRPSDTKYLLKTNGIENQILTTPLLWVDLRGNKHVVYRCMEKIAYTHAFHGITPKENCDEITLCAVLNSSLVWFFVEMLGRRGLGGGAVRVLVKELQRNFLIINPNLISPKEKFLEAFRQICSREVRPLLEELDLEDRRNFDSYIFQTIGLNTSEVASFYDQLTILTKDRMEKVLT